MNVALHPQSLNLISLCTGGGGLDLGVELAIPNARPVVLVEGEAWSVATLVQAMESGLMAPAPVWSDVRTFDGRPWRGLVDGLIGGIPCFAPGTMVLARDGYRPIEQLRVGDLVLTHKGRWRRITSVMSRDGAAYREIRAQGCAGILTTDEHPFFAVDARGATPSWIEAFKLERRRHRLAQVLPPQIDHKLSGEVLWLLGRFLADGWTWDRRVTGAGNPIQSEQGRVVICCAKREQPTLAERIGRLGIAFNAQEERTVVKFYIADQGFWRLARKFGRLAHGKLLPGWCLELDQSGARALLDGYVSGDGSKRVNRGKPIREVGTVSKALAYGIALLVQRAHGIVAGVKRYRPTDTKISRCRLTCSDDGDGTVTEIILRKSYEGYGLNDLAPWSPTRKWLWVHRRQPHYWFEAFGLPHVVARAFPEYIMLGEVFYD